MLPLEQLETLDRQIQALLAELPSFDPALTPTADARQRVHDALADFWTKPDSSGTTSKQRLIALRGEQLLAEIQLRLGDRTLDIEQAYLLRVCLELPLAWQRRHLPSARRPQVYRPLLEGYRPNWRSHLPGVLVIVEGSPEGAMLSAEDDTGNVLLCCLSQGIEAFASLQALHTELCERLDDPVQSVPLLHLYADPEQAERARRADRLRYDWYADDLLTEQVEQLLNTQRQRLNQASAWQQPATIHVDLDQQLRTALQLQADIGSQPALTTRYSLLLEKHLPNWLRMTTPQGLSHIMQTLQKLASAAELAAAPGILNLTQFQEQHSLLAWTQARLAERLRSDLGLAYAPTDILVSIVRARQVGPHLNPFAPSIHVAGQGLKQLDGELIEMVKETYTLDVLALNNLPWFDVDYWLTARVTHRHGLSIPAVLSPAYVKATVRDLNAGGRYGEFLYTQLIDSKAGRWRLHAHARVNRARLRAEAVKARYAGHFIQTPDERGYSWVTAVLDYPDNALRPPLAGRSVKVRQLLIKGHTVQGVLLINAVEHDLPSFVLYTPDAPDRRAWREFANTRELLRSLRRNPALRDYIAKCLPQHPPAETERLLRHGRLGPALTMPLVNGELFFVYYMAEVRALLATADASSRSTAEVNVQSVIDATWRLVDVISLVLPNRALMALSIGRMAIDIWDGFEAYQRHDAEGVLRYAYSALGHANDGATSYVGTGLIRRALRGIPKQPPLPVPPRYQVRQAAATLRYRIDGIYGEGVFEQISPFGGLTEYFVQDNQDRYYKVAFDGQRWRAVDPHQPDAYLKLPLKRLASGEWVIDSPLLWHEGLPDLQGLLDSCRLSTPLEGEASALGNGLHQADQQLYLQTGAGQLPLRRHLLAGYYHLQIPTAQEASVVPWAILRWDAQQWHIRVRQTGRSSAWLALPAAYSVSLGSS